MPKKPTKEPGIIATSLKIWRDHSPRGFITYVPVVAVNLSVSVVWFVMLSMLIIGVDTVPFMQALIFFNMLFCIAGVPILLTILHLRMSQRDQKKYFSASALYILPGTLLYNLLALINNYLIIAFNKGGERAEKIKEMLTSSWQNALAAAVITLLLGAIAQILLTVTLRMKTKPGEIKLKLRK